MKLIIKKNVIEDDGVMMPRFYGVAYIEMNTSRIVYAVIPLNIIIYYLRKIRHIVKTFGSRDMTEEINKKS